MGALAPFVWNPKPVETAMGGGCGQIAAGEWVQVQISFRQGSTPVVSVPGSFMIHAILTPETDDATPHPDQATTYGGNPNGTNRRRKYRIDPGIWFQAPFNSQLLIVAGGDAGPTCICDIVIARGFPPRESSSGQQVLVSDEFGFPVIDYLPSQLRNVGRRLWPPPVVGAPGQVAATWGPIPANTPIEFPDGAVSMEAVDQTGTPGNPIAFDIAALGNVLRFNVASGMPRRLGPFAQGGACTNGTPATWTCAIPLSSVTIYSSLGG